MGEIPFQIGVGVKAGIEIGSDQEGVIGDSYKGIIDLHLRDTGLEECAFNIYIWSVDSVCVNW